MLKNFSIVILFVFFSKNSQAQNESNVPYQSLVAINPSFAGSNGFIRDQFFFERPVYRYLNYFSCNNALDVYLPSLKSGIALSTNYYQHSSYRNSSGAVSYAKYFVVKEQLKIIPSLQIAYSFRQYYVGSNANGILPRLTYNPPWASSGYFSVSGGLLVNYKNFYGGVSVYNMNRPDVGIYGEEKTNPLYNFHASYNLKISDRLLFNLYGQYTTRKNYDSQSIALNALVLKHLIYGLSYHWREAAVMNIGCRTNNLTIQVAYNKNISRLMPSGINADYWQFIMSLNLRNKEQRNKITNFEAW